MGIPHRRKLFPNNHYVKSTSLHLIRKAPHMSNPLALRIPEPCHQDWNDMQPNEKGRHCNACQKTVVDFTSMSDQEILQYMNRAKRDGANVCGRARNSQLSRRLVVPNAPLIRNGLPGWAGKSGWRWLLATAVITTDTVALQKNWKGQPMERFEYRNYMPDEHALMGAIAIDPASRIDSSIILSDTIAVMADSVSTHTVGFIAPEVIKGDIKIDTIIEPEPIVLGKMSVIKLDTAEEPVLTGAIRLAPADTLDQSPVCTKTNPYSLRRIIVDTLRTLRILPPEPLTNEPPTNNPTTNYPTTNYPTTQTRSQSQSQSSSAAPIISPNPIPRGSTLHLTWQTPAGDYQLALYNTSGALIQSKFIQLPNPVLTLDWPIPSNIGAGVYFLNITTREQKQTIKLIID
jgi:hypothetical protein